MDEQMIERFEEIEAALSGIVEKLFAKGAPEAGMLVSQASASVGVLAQEITAAHSVMAGKVAELTWQPIETAWRVGEQPIIVTDGAEVYGAAWWHSREEAWLDCGGITPTHWMPLPDPPRRSSPLSRTPK